VTRDQYGRVTITEDEAFRALYSNTISNISDVNLDDSKIIWQFNEALLKNADRIAALESLKELDISISEFDCGNQKNWFMPEEYRNFDIVDFLLSQTQNEEQYQRVITELELYIQYNMLEVLIYIKYLVDTMRTNKIVWGVGRGSSVASYVLYLIGIHKIDSIKYNLDIHEFLK
jgi:DNA polymerase III alpha subunit